MVFDPAKPVRTRDGREARIICTDAKGDFPIVALLRDGDGEWPIKVKESGKYYTNDELSDHDLINTPERVSRWVNAYRAKLGCTNDTRDKADTYKLENRKAVLEIIFEGDMPVETIIHRDV